MRPAPMQTTDAGHIQSALGACRAPTLLRSWADDFDRLAAPLQDLAYGQVRGFQIGLKRPEVGARKSLVGIGVIA